MNYLQRFFWWCAGANPAILKECPSDHSKYFGLGGTVFFTAAMASLAGGYAFYTAFDDAYLAAAFGAFWGLLILNLDRYIISTIGIGETKQSLGNKLLKATPRLIMAMFIGFVIAIPLELKIFDKEIQIELAKMQDEEKKINLNNSSAILAENELKNLEKVSTQKANIEGQLTSSPVPADLKTKKEELERKISQYRRELSNATNKRQNWVNRYTNEANREYPDQNKLARYAKNRDSYYSEIKRFEGYINSLSNQLSTTNNNISKFQSSIRNQKQSELEGLAEIEKRGQAQLDSLNKIKLKEIARLDSIANNYDGLMARMEALDRLSHNEVKETQTVNGEPKEIIQSEWTSYFYAKWFLTIFLIIIEVAPVLFKLMVSEGPYDFILARVTHEIRVKELQKISNLNESINIDLKLHSQKNQERLKVEAQANEDLLKAVASAQTDIAKLAIERWRLEQMDKATTSSSGFVKTTEVFSN